MSESDLEARKLLVKWSRSSALINISLKEFDNRAQTFSGRVSEFSEDSDTVLLMLEENGMPSGELMIDLSISRFGVIGTLEGYALEGLDASKYPEHLEIISNDGPRKFDLFTVLRS